MEQQHNSMIEPPIEGLLDKAESKFRLVTLGARRARDINSYFGGLGETLGGAIPPQVTSVSQKALSIAFEEISEDKIVPVVIDPEDEAALAEALAEQEAAAAAEEESES